LPFGTKVRVENTANGRSVEVRINDRGSFIPGRMIDMSKAVAEAVDIMADGVAEVFLSVIQPQVSSVMSSPLLAREQRRADQN
jgi:peptidoglycan lytic transglycosylase